jgi:PAS domain S-box-containing protein
MNSASVSQVDPPVLEESQMDSVVETEVRRTLPKWLQPLSRFWRNLSLRRKGLVVVAIPVSMLLLTMGSAYVVSLKYEQAANSVHDALEVEAAIHSLHVVIIEAETKARGYLLTGQREFLSQYENIVQEISPTLLKLEKLVQDHQTQSGHVDKIKSLVRDADTQRASLIDQDLASFERSAMTQQLSANKIRLDQIRGSLAAMKSEEERLLLKRTSWFQQLKVWADMVTWIGTLFGVSGGVVAALLLSNGIIRRIHFLRENAHRLSEELPLAPASGAADEIGNLEQQLKAASLLLAARGQSLRAETERLTSEIAERKRIEQELRDNKQQLETAVHANQLVMEYSQDVICTVDEQGQFVSVSSASEKLWGYKPSELIGRRYIDFVHPDDHLRTSQAAADIIAGHTTRDFENRYIRKDGSVVPVTWSAFWSEADKIMFCVARDNTDRHRAVEALEQAKREAERANRAKSEFLSRMSHELRTPLNAIIGFGQILEMDPSGDDRESIDQILKAGRHLLALINEVLDISGIEAGRMSISIEPVSVNHLLDECVQLIRPLAAQRRIRLEGNFSLDCDRHVIADRQRLKQVLLNLLSNGVKYNRDGGTVSLSCEESSEGLLRINIADTGYGIAPENIDRLFSPFERLNAEQTGVEGTGLGLAVSKRLIELMGGKIDVQSAVGKGSAFSVELPLGEAPLAVAERELQQIGEPTTIEPMTQQTVLYIEDNLSNLRLIERILVQRPGVKLIAAMQGNLGLELAREHQPDLVLLDLNLPDVPGREVLQRLKAESATRDTPVIIISADATPGEVARLSAAGASAYLTKPFDVKKFLDLLDENLHQRLVQSV